jgi:hypothetical protein
MDVEWPIPIRSNCKGSESQCYSCCWSCIDTTHTLIEPSNQAIRRFLQHLMPSVCEILLLSQMQKTCWWTMHSTSSSEGHLHLEEEMLGFEWKFCQLPEKPPDESFCIVWVEGGHAINFIQHLHILVHLQIKNRTPYPINLCPFSLISIQDCLILVMAKDIILSPNSYESTNLPVGLNPTNGTPLLLTPHEPTSNIKARTKLQFKVCY